MDLEIFSLCIWIFQLVNVQFRTHNFSSRKYAQAQMLCVCVRIIYFTRFIFEKVFDLIEFVNQKLHRNMGAWLELVLVCARYGMKKRKYNQIHSMQRMKYNLITLEELAALAQNQCSPPIAVNKLPFCVCYFSRSFVPPSLLRSSFFFSSIVALLFTVVVYERTIVFSGQTSGSTDFSINSSRCAQPPALPNNHQYFNLTFCCLPMEMICV